MMSEELTEYAIATLCLVLLQKRIARNKKRNKQLWARKWLQRRDNSRGMSHMIFNEIRYEDPASFRNFCRMSSDLFMMLLDIVEPRIKRQDTILRECISARSRLLLTLRYLATGESYQSLSYSFRISVPSISKIIPKTVSAIYDVLKDKYLKTPTTRDEWLNIADRFNKEWQFPNCLGALDGKHIAFRAKKADGSFYFNYKQFHSIILMALVDADYNFIYVDVGCNGRASDGGVYMKSSLCKGIEKNLMDFSDDSTLPKSTRKVPFVIVADDAFKLSKRMMKPTGQRSNQEEKVFNYRLSRARRVVENAFGILATRFQVLQKEINLEVEKVQNITLACCALHNYIKEKEGKKYFYNNIDIENTTNVTLLEGEWRANIYLTNLNRCNVNRSPDDGIEVKKHFVNYFNNEGFVPWQWEAIKKFNF